MKATATCPYSNINIKRFINGENMGMAKSAFMANCCTCIRLWSVHNPPVVYKNRTQQVVQGRKQLNKALRLP